MKMLTDVLLLVGCRSWFIPPKSTLLPMAYCLHYVMPLSQPVVGRDSVGRPDCPVCISVNVNLHMLLQLSCSSLLLLASYRPCLQCHARRGANAASDRPNVYSTVGMPDFK